MQIHEIVKNTLTQHKNKIQLIQWSMISGISSLLYPAYLMAMKSKLKPRKLVLVPKIEQVVDLLNPDNDFIKTLSDIYVDRIKNHPLIQQFKDAPELMLFDDDHVEIMKTIYDLYITPNIVKRIPETIAKKFDLSNDKQQVFIEDKSIDYFGGRATLNDDEFKFIIDETVLQLLILMPTVKKHIEYPEQKKQMFMTDDEILIITNANGICPIMFSKDIYENKCIMDILSFVTNTNISDIEWQTKSLFKNNTVVVREASTDIFNEASLVTLEVIQDITEEDNGSET